jgi:hypothetical protein
MNARSGRVLGIIQVCERPPPPRPGAGEPPAGRAGSSYVLAQAAFQDGACVALAECVMVKAGPGLGAGPLPLTEAERELLTGLAFRGTL